MLPALPYFDDRGEAKTGMPKEVHVPLMTIFYIFAGVTALGIFYVLFLVKSDAGGNLVTKMAPEDVIKFTNSQQSKKANEQHISVKKQGFLSKMKLGKKKKGTQAELLSMEPVNQTQTLEPPAPKKGNSLMSKLSEKLPFGKNRINPQDDIPQATKFSDIEKHLAQRQYKINKDEQTAEANDTNEQERPATGTAGMTTSKPPKEEDDDIIRINDPALKKEEETPPPANSTDEWQTKYEKLDAMFQEQTQELEKTKQILINEMKNRNDYTKVKNILDEEIKNLKDHSKELEQSLSEAREESEEQGKYAQQLKDKITSLEDNLPQKVKEPDQAKTEPSMTEITSEDAPNTGPEKPASSSVEIKGDDQNEGTPMNFTFDPTTEGTSDSEASLEESLEKYEENIKKSLDHTDELPSHTDENQEEESLEDNPAAPEEHNPLDEDQDNNPSAEKKE